MAQRTSARLVTLGARCLRLSSSRLHSTALGSRTMKCVHARPLLVTSRASISTTLPKCFSFNVQDEEDFETRVLKSDIPVVVDFHAEWCGPCKILGPKLETIIGSYDGKVALAKVDIDDLQELSVKYGVQQVPTVVAIKSGENVNKFIGVPDDVHVQTFVANLVEDDDD